MIAIAMWALAFLLILASTIVGLTMGNGQMPIVIALAAHGLALSAAAATMSVRQMFKSQNKLLRDAFDLGREAGGNSDPVRRLH